MENKKDINTILSGLEKLLYGYNYMVELGAVSFDHCHSMEDFKVLLKDRFPGSRPDWFKRKSTIRKGKKQGAAAKAAPAATGH